jgi:NADH-quinone oxidoreductase subunit G
MPKLIIDNREIEVPKGTKVIEAAERLGIIIPRFCYHPALGSLGACRLCAVHFLEGPVKGIEMSCLEQARDGMVVSTTDARAVDFRRQVIEWLMMNHPHDCPVCDEGGHCLLQDLTVAGGQGLRRFLGKKRTYTDQDLGVFVQHEMNRCIHCFRCRRFYQEFAGYRDFGALQIAGRTYFGRLVSGPLESPFSGNLIDLCPTGVLTDKPSRYKGRRWDYERSPSICIHCSLGCRVISSSRYREVVRIEAGFSNTVNGYFICDRGRYGFDYVNHPERSRMARIGKNEVPPDQAIREAAERLSQITHQFGKEAVACHGTGRSSLETLGMLKVLSRRQGWPEPGYLSDPLGKGIVKKILSRLDGRVAVSLREVEQADSILVVGCDPVNEAPMLAMAIRQAFRKGAAVTVIDPRPVFLPLRFEHLPIAPGELDACLAVLIKGVASPPAVKAMGGEVQSYYETLPEAYSSDSETNNRLAETTQRLKQSLRPIIVCGTGVVRETTPALAADLALFLQVRGQQAGLFYVLEGANAFGAALLSSPENSFLKTIADIEKGAVAALVLVETDPFWFFPDRSRLEQALGKLEFLLVMDYLPSPAAGRADIFLPTQTLFEAGGIYVNQEGRAQLANPVYRGGIPLEQTGGGAHPPRRISSHIPGGESKPAWQMLSELGRFLSPGEKFPIDSLWTELALGNPIFTPLQTSKIPSEGIRLIPDRIKEESFSPSKARDWGKNQVPSDFFELHSVDQTFGTEELSAYSRPARGVAGRPYLTMPFETGRLMDLQNRDRVILTFEGGPLEVEVNLNDHMASGIMILPRHGALAWQKMTAIPEAVSWDRIKKVDQSEVA